MRQKLSPKMELHPTYKVNIENAPADLPKKAIFAIVTEMTLETSGPEF